MTRPSSSDSSFARSLFQHYVQAWREAWQQRKLMQPPSREKDDIDFLPAALALQEQPVHPAPRYIQSTIMVFVLLALIWSCIGKIDVVTTATGKIVVDGRSKTIQSSGVATVKAIYVQDGQSVKTGDLLVELDSSQADADTRRSHDELITARLDAARANSLLHAINNGDPLFIPTLAPMEDISPEQHAVAQRWVEEQYREFAQTLLQSGAEIEQRQAEIISANAQIVQLKLTLPMSERVASDYQQLMAKGIVSKHATLEKQQIVLERKMQLIAQQTKVIELAAAKKQAEFHRKTTIAQTQRSTYELKEDAEHRISTSHQELSKSQYQQRLMRLTSPIDGTVQQLVVHTLGGVVTEAQALMLVVPTDQPLEVEATVSNKDIGFVRPGQDVEIKIDTYTFTRYGIVHGNVISVSNDAIDDEKRGPVYSARIQLDKKYILFGDKKLALTPGMSVQAEVKTDKRRIIDYFLSPLEQYAQESLKER